MSTRADVAFVVVYTIRVFGGKDASDPRETLRRRGRPVWTGHLPPSIAPERQKSARRGSSPFHLDRGRRCSANVDAVATSRFDSATPAGKALLIVDRDCDPSCCAP